MNDVISYWFNAIKSIVNSFFGYEITSGVTFGWFVLACFLMAVVVRFTYTKIVK